MFGKIININDKYVKIENKTGKIQANVMNYHVIFENNGIKVVGEILGMDEKTIDVVLLGEIKDNIFFSGILKYPSVESICRIIYKEELELIIGSQDYTNSKNLLIGSSTLYNGFKVTANINDFFSQHFSIIGNSGCGKSCGVATLIQNMFYNKKRVPKNAHIVIFDVYGEYHASLTKINAMPDINVKYLTADSETQDTSTEMINIPAYFLEVDDLALLLNVTDQSLLPVLEKTLQFVVILKKDPQEAINFKNSIISKCILDIISSGKTATQLSDQIISILNRFNTENLNLESPIVEPGYTRTLKQCLNLDANGKIAALQSIIEFLNQFATEQSYDVDRKDLIYDLEDISLALEYALMSEGILNNESLFEKASNLRVRLHSILNSSQKKYFTTSKEYVEKEQFVKSMFLTSTNEFVQVLNINFKYIEKRFAKVLTKIYMKLFFNFSISLPVRASFPIHVILEEAHSYVQNDNDVNIIGYNIFDRITKEGRKYGLILGFVTQRPSELSSTCLSQCSNFLVFRIFHPDDLEIVKSISGNVSSQEIEKLKTLSPGNALAFGSAFRVPLLTKLELPNPMTASTNVNLESSWYN